MQVIVSDARALLEQAEAVRRAGDVARSAELVEQASKTAPDDPQIQYDVALTWLTLGRPAVALPYLERAVALQPGFGLAHLRHGLVLEVLSLPGACSAYQQAIAVAPELSEPYRRLAAVRGREGKRNDAVMLYREAARRSSDREDAEVCNARAALLEADLDAAEACLQRALAIDSNAHKALGLLAYIQNARGNFVAAEASMAKALLLQPYRFDLYYSFVHTRKIRADDAALIGRMREALSWTIPVWARVQLHLALAKALDDLADYQEAATHLKAASALRARHFPFDRDALTAQVDRLIRLFPADRLKQADHRRSESETPILVVGMPRSGTTLTEQILSSHPLVAGGGELHFWAAKGPEFLLSDVFDPGVAAEGYLATLRAVSATAERVVDKNPFNFMWAGLVHLVFPKARIIHCRRHPSDTCLSAMLADISQPRFSNSVDDLVFYYEQYKRMMRHYRSVLPKDRFLDLDYETLVEDPSTQVRSLIAFCGLPWDDACLAPERNRRTVLTSSVSQARQPIHASSAGRRRHYEALLQPFEALAESR